VPSTPASDFPTVQVLYFAALRDLARTGEERVRLPEPPNAQVRGLLELLEASHEGLRGRLATVRVAVNEEFVEPTAALHEGDVVALIPPVSGG
jgi:sulfur-carrier protein